jgi:hypothetical protein
VTANKQLIKILLLNGGLESYITGFKDNNSLFLLNFQRVARAS